MKAIILAAGKGKRLRPLTNRIPKCMITICGKPMLKWQVELLKKYNVNYSLFVLDGSSKKNILLSARNIPEIKITEPQYLNLFDIIKYEKIPNKNQCL